MNQRDYRGAIWLAMICLVTGLAATILEYTSNSQPLPWLPLDEARRVARATNKPIFVDVYADWCGPCREMDRRVFSQDSVRMLLTSEFVIAKVNIDDPDVGDSVRNQYKITSLPTYLLLAPDGVERKRVRGFQPASRLMRWLNDRSMLYVGIWPDYPSASSEAQQTRMPLLVLLVQSGAGLRAINTYLDVPALREEIDNNFMRTVVIQSEPNHRRAAEELKIYDYPLAEGEGLILVLDWQGKERGRFRLSTTETGNELDVARKLRELSQSQTVSGQQRARQPNEIMR